MRCFPVALIWLFLLLVHFQGSFGQRATGKNDPRLRSNKFKRAKIRVRSSSSKPKGPPPLVEKKKSNRPPLPDYTTPSPKTCSKYPSLSVANTSSFPSFQIVIYSENDMVSGTIAHNRHYEIQLSHYMIKVLKLLEGSVLLDFGANLGWYSLLAASKGHRTISIEAIPCNHWALSQSIKINGFEKLITLHNKALAASPSASSGSATGSICLDSTAAEDHNLGNSMLQMKSLSADSSSDCNPSFLVPTTPLHLLIPKETHLGFMKADCEGCEPSVILASRELFFSSSAPCAVMIEAYLPHIKNFEGEQSNHLLAEAGKMLLQAGYIFVEIIPGSNGLRLVGKETQEFQSLFTADYLQNLKAILPTDRCFPPGSERWIRLFSTI
jgi:FkbM family methyltransferase